MRIPRAIEKEKEEEVEKRRWPHKRNYESTSLVDVGLEERQISGSRMDVKPTCMQDSIFFFIGKLARAGWLKWQLTSVVLCDWCMSTRLQGKFSRTTIRLSMICGAECWPTIVQHLHKMSVVEMRMLRCMSCKTMKDGIRNEYIREHLEIAPINNKLRETCMRRFGHVQHKPLTAPMRISFFSGSTIQKWE